MMPKSKWEKKSATELKSHLKGMGMSGTGDKGTLIWRIKLREKEETHGLVTADGKPPTLLKAAELKKCCARAGLSPIGSSDELLSSLVDHLVSISSSSSSPAIKSEKNSAGSKEGELAEASNVEKRDPSGVAIAKKILSLDETDDFEGILNLLGGATRVTRSSPVAAMRKAYLKLSLLVHPDKLASSFDQATKAFQALVRALERLSQPEVQDDPLTHRARGRQREASMGISRSNEGCYRTKVCCPRCRQAWSEGTLDGNPDYFYNFLMTGLKCYSCSTCLFEFGAVTALHFCPHCLRAFQYSPGDYHRQVKCGNEGCMREFGFLLYHVSSRAMTETKRAVREEQARQAKEQRTRQRRAGGRAGKRGGSEDSQEDKEQAFVLGLSDCCPRCGEFFEHYREEGALQRLHLLQCGDRDKHALHRDKEAGKERDRLKREQDQERQKEVQGLAQWELMGGRSSQLHLLSDSQLLQVADREREGAGEEAESLSREDLVRCISSRRRARARAREDTGARKRLKSTGVREDHSLSLVLPPSPPPSIHPDDVPVDLHSLAKRELRLFCASQGLSASKGATSAELIELIEDAME